MKLNIKEARELMIQISKRRGNPLGTGTVESYLAPLEISTVIDRLPSKHMRFFLGLDINIVVNTMENGSGGH